MCITKGDLRKCRTSGVQARFTHSDGKYQTKMPISIFISCTKQLHEEPVTEYDPEPEFQVKLSLGFTSGTSVKTISPVWLPLA